MQVNEYEIIPSSKFSQKELEEIKRFNDFYGVEIFKFTSKGVKPQQFVGVCRIGDKTIEILPKISEKSDQERETERDNLLFMLSYTKKLPIKEVNLTNLSKNDTIYEVIISIFSKHLLDLLKKEYWRKYKEVEENSNYLKGKLLIPKHIQYNSFNKTKFYCKYDELNEDNLLNQIFKATINKLLQITKNSESINTLKKCDFILSNVTLRRINYRETKRVNFNRMNKHYENLFRLSTMILFGNSPKLSEGNNKTFSLLFDMNKLFEEFIFEFIKRNINKNALYEKPRRHLFKEKPIYQLKPDIVIKRVNGHVKQIIDTKYKLINNTFSEISTSDVYQMFVYSQIYECNEIILLYPQNKQEIKEVEFNGDKYCLEFNIKIRTVNLHRNLLNKECRIELKDELKNILSSI